MSQLPQNNIDEYSILSAIWILVCNDDAPFLLYSSTELRLNLPDSFQLKKLIKKHGELFKPNCSLYDLETVKSQDANLLIAP